MSLSFKSGWLVYGAKEDAQKAADRINSILGRYTVVFAHPSGSQFAVRFKAGAADILTKEEEAVAVEYLRRSRTPAEVSSRSVAMAASVADAKAKGEAVKRPTMVAAVDDWTDAKEA